MRKVLFASLLSCSLVFSGLGNHDAEAASVTNIAKDQLGTPYVWGGTTPSGFDCSGFVYYTYNKIGVTLPRTAAEMYKTGQSITKSGLKNGDLVFFSTYKAGASHVGIYIGDNQFIHAGTSEVRTDSLSNSYWSKAYLGAKRISGVSDAGWVNSDGSWYFYNDAGDKETGWVKWKSQWYLLDTSTGKMETGWEKDSNEWYYLKDSGVMKTGWQLYKNDWYYMKSNGEMVENDWVYYQNEWYYMLADGSMATDTVIDGYVIGSDGVWVK